MRRNHLLYLEDILESAGNIQNYAAGFSFDDLIKDKMRIDALVKQTTGFKNCHTINT